MIPDQMIRLFRLCLFIMADLVSVKVLLLEV